MFMNNGIGWLAQSINHWLIVVTPMPCKVPVIQNQVEVMLGSIQEVLIFDSTIITIEFANEAAKRLFQHGRLLKGARLNQPCVRRACWSF